MFALYNYKIVMNQKNIFFLTLAILVTLSIWMTPETQANPGVASRILLSTYNTNPIRTATVVKFCEGLDRYNLVD